MSLRITKLMLLIICLAMLGSTAYGQKGYSREQQLSGVMGRAQLHYNLGLAAKANNDFALIRAEFDQSVDELITSGFNMSADPNLHNYYQQS